MLPVQNWVDSFHTGYNLDALIAYQELTEDHAFNGYIEKGFDYYVNHFFEADGTPKYYDNRMYPIDIHCPGQLLITLTRLHKMKKYEELAKKGLSALPAPTGLSGDMSSDLDWYNDGYAFHQACPDEDTFTQNAEAYLNYFKLKYDGRFGVTKLFMYGVYVYAKYY